MLARFTAAGTPDPGFGEGGRVSLSGLAESHVGIEGRGVEALAGRPGGGVFAGGGSGPLAFLAALGSNGSLDPALGSDGVASVTEPHGARAGAHAIAVDSRGRILVGGGTDSGLSTAGPEGAVFRFLPGGGVDRGFGEGAGFARVPYEANSIALAGSSIYILSHHESLLSRLTSSGRLDQGFGSEGTVVPNLGRALPHSLATLRGGGVLLAGTSLGGRSRGVVGRISASGARDRAFGKGGLATLTFGYRHRCGAEALAVQRDGRILVAGYVVGKLRHRTVERLAVMRLLADGKVDRSFGRGGVVSVARGVEARATAIVVQRDGQILVAGRSRERKRATELFLRLSAAGRLERGFGHGGIASIRPADGSKGSPRGNVEPTQILIRPHGYLVVGKGPGLPIVSYDHRGHADPRFAAGLVPADSRNLGAPAAALQRGRLVVARSTRTPETFEVRRLAFAGP